MARSAQAKESFRLQVLQTTNAQGISNVKIPGYMKVNRKYTGGNDSQGGDWYQLCPSWMFTTHKYMVEAHKGGRSLFTQFEGIDMVDGLDSQRIDYKG